MTYHYKWNEQPECDFDNATLNMYNGTVCDNTVQIRRLAFVAEPDYMFSGIGLKILRYDDVNTSSFINDIRTDQYNNTPYIFNKSNYGTAPWKSKLDPF